MTIIIILCNHIFCIIIIIIIIIVCILLQLLQLLVSSVLLYTFYSFVEGCDVLFVIKTILPNNMIYIQYNLLDEDCML